MPAEFRSLPLRSDLLTVLEELGLKTMTPIQEQSLPLLLQNKDLVGQSKTGSGKTAAFALSVLNKINLDWREPQALVLCPTRELCAQVAREIRKLGRRFPGLHVLILSGGQPGKPQMYALQKGAHIIVGTPGRVRDHVERGNLDLNRLETLVLDEADRMLDMGFEEDMTMIMDEAPGTRQTLFFSATFPSSIQEMSERFQHGPEHIVIENVPEERPLIEQRAYEVEGHEKTETLLRILERERAGAAIVFCNLKVTVAEVGKTLRLKGLSAEAIHGDLTQEDRDRVLAKFRNGSTRVLVATDVAARGLDVAGLPLVVNYDVPLQSEVYVHRIGRTGRAGEKGLAVSLYSENEQRRLDNVIRETGFEIELKTLEPVRGHQQEYFGENAEMATLYIAGGRKEKVRPADILGALTGQAGGLEGAQVGKIEIHDHFSYVAVPHKIAEVACQKLRDGRIKGRKFQIKIVR